MKLIIALIFTFLLAQNCLTAQNIEVLDGRKIDFYGSEALIKKDPLSYPTYLKAKEAKKASKVLGYISLGSLGGGLALIFLTPEKKGFCNGVLCFSDAQIIGVYSILFVFPIAGTLGILSGISAKGRFRRTVDIYNNNNNHPLGYREKEPVDLSFGLSQNGLGFVLKF